MLHNPGPGAFWRSLVQKFEHTPAVSNSLLRVPSIPSVFNFLVYYFLGVPIWQADQFSAKISKQPCSYSYNPTMQA